MSSSRALCCFLSVNKRKHDFHFISLNVDSVFVLSRIIKVEVRVISLSLGLRQADNPYLDLDYSGYHKNLIQ